MPRALIISFVEWAGAFQRPQHLAVELARQGWEVTYLGPAYPHRGAAGLGAGFELPETLTLVSARALPGGRIFSVLERYNESSFRRTAAELGGTVHGPVSWDAVIFNDPRWAEAAAATRARVRVWDRMDDLSESAPTEAWGREREADALGLADLIWTGTPSLEALTLDQLGTAGLKKPARFLACGVDVERFGTAEIGAMARARDEMGGGSGAAPVAVYFGAINERMNGKYVEALLEAGWRVALIGPGSSRAPRLRAAEGLRLLGPRAYDALPAYLGAADAALIPYHTEGANRHLYPVKALEYLAGAKPVLSTPLPNVEKVLGDYVWIGALPEDWTQLAQNWKKYRDLLQERALAGQAWVRGRTWAAMAAEMAAEIEDRAREIQKGGRRQSVSKVRPAGSEELKTDGDAGVAAAARRNGGTENESRNGEAEGRETSGRETSGRATRAREGRGRETRSREAKGRDTKTREAKGRDTKTREAKGRNTKARETKSRDTKARETKSRETKSRERKRETGHDAERPAVKVVPSAPPKKFPVREVEDWGSQSLLERLTKKRPPEPPPAPTDASPEGGT